MTLQFKTKHCDGILLHGFDIIYDFTIGKFIPTSVPASIYYFNYFLQKVMFFVSFNFAFLLSI